MPIVGIVCCIDPCICSAAGGNRTIGLLDSDGKPNGRDTDEPAGDIIPSRGTSRASEDLLLIATLGE